MIGRNEGSLPQGLTNFPTLLDWQEPGWWLGHSVSCPSCVESHM